jgi:hypothetical protein
VVGRQGRRRKQLLDDLKEKRRYCKLKEETLDNTLENWFWKGPWTCLKTDCGIKRIAVYRETHKKQIHKPCSPNTLILK